MREIVSFSAVFDHELNRFTFFCITADGSVWRNESGTWYNVFGGGILEPAYDS